jgi:hypothetical protein
MKITLLLFLVVSLFAGCATVDKHVREIPGFAFKSWSHSDRYGLFTDSIVASGAKWTINADGSATLTLDHYDGQAAWAGTVGPHDVIESLEIVFPATSPQAQALQLGVRPAVPRMNALPEGATIVPFNVSSK